MMQKEHLKKFEELFRQKYVEITGGIASEEKSFSLWKDYLEKHNLRTEVKKNNNEMVIVTPWPDLPFAIPKSFFESTLVLGDLP